MFLAVCIRGESEWRCRNLSKVFETRQEAEDYLVNLWEYPDCERCEANDYLLTDEDKTSLSALLAAGEAAYSRSHEFSIYYEIHELDADDEDVTEHLINVVYRCSLVSWGDVAKPL